MSKDRGGPAFPSKAYFPATGGMTRRQYYAAHAPVTLADAITWQQALHPTHRLNRTGDGSPQFEIAWLAVLAKMRFAYADAMLAHEEQEEQEVENG